MSSDIKSRAESIRDENKRRGGYIVVKTILFGYLTLSIVLFLASIIEVIRQLIPNFLFSGKLTLPIETLPIWLVHILLFMNSHDYFEKYFVIWDRNLKDRLSSLILTPVHIFCLVACATWPKLWLICIIPLIFSVYLKNKLSRNSEPEESPIRELLDKWVHRSRNHLFLSIIAGPLLATFSNSWFYRNILKVDVTNSDVSVMIEFVYALLNWIALLLILFAILGRIIPREAYSKDDITQYEKEVENYLCSSF